MADEPLFISLLILLACSTLLSSFFQFLLVRRIRKFHLSIWQKFGVTTAFGFQNPKVFMRFLKFVYWRGLFESGDKMLIFFGLSRNLFEVASIGAFIFLIWIGSYFKGGPA